jgi:uncharacterized membrane protein YgdD (TMEM256/DUF423 family)
VLIAWVVGPTLFAGDVSARALIGHRLFPMAAPTGGTILIAAWLALAIAALAGAFQRGYYRIRPRQHPRPKPDRPD